MAEDVEFIEMALNRGDIDQAKGYYQNVRKTSAYFSSLCEYISQIRFLFIK